MDGDDGFGVDPFGGVGGEFGAHGEAVADGDHGDVGLAYFADEFHVAEECGVAGVVDFVAAHGDDQAAGLAHVSALVA